MLLPGTNGRKRDTEAGGYTTYRVVGRLVKLMLLGICIFHEHVTRIIYAKLFGGLMATEFPGSLILPPPPPGGSKMRDPGNEVLINAF